MGGDKDKASRQRSHEIDCWQVMVVPVYAVNQSEARMILELLHKVQIFQLVRNVLAFETINQNEIIVLRPACRTGRFHISGKVESIGYNNVQVFDFI